MKRMTCAVLLLWSASAAAQQIESDDCLILPSSEVEIGATVPGLLDEVSVDRGDRVVQGQVVARLRSDVQGSILALAKARADNPAPLKAAEARLNFERQELERAEGLIKRRVISQQQLDERRTAFEVRLREYEEAEAEAEIARLEQQRAEAELEVRLIRSPIDGVVTARGRDGGEYLRDDGSVVTVARLDPLRVEVFLPQEAYPDISLGAQVSIRTDLDQGIVHQATVTVIDPVIDASSATFGVRLDLPNPGLRLIAGTRCTAQF